MKLSPSFIFVTLLVTLIGIPFVFNFGFLWDSGLAKGEMSDWFTLYGNIFGGLIGGFFTYVALMLTFKQTEEEKMPQIDIPHQTFGFVDTNDKRKLFAPVIIELNNIGGSIAKNIECKLLLSNYEKVIEYLQANESELDILVKEEIITIGTSKKKRHEIVVTGIGVYKGYLTTLRKEIESSLLGSCLPIHISNEAVVKYVLPTNLRNWINYIGRNLPVGYNIKDVLFEFELEVKYSTIKGEEISERFKLNWEDAGISLEGKEMKYNYISRTTKLEGNKK